MFVCKNPTPMKKHLCFTLVFAACIGFCGIAQDQGRQEIVDFQDRLYKEFTDSVKSPLPKYEIDAFTGHEFYPVDLSYRVKARLVKTPGEKPFKMMTTRGETQDYVKYGEAQFILRGKPYKLNLYQSTELSKTAEYKDYLFLPFKDLTNLLDTYGGGRYIDLKIPASDSIVIDFNQAYNPYCAYNSIYSCPVPPKENTLETEIKAGIKRPPGH